MGKVLNRKSLLPSLERVREVFSYDKETGLLFFRVDLGNQYGNKGKPAGFLRSDGYIQNSVDGKKVLGHRLVWFHTYGSWPPILDHIDGDRSNNRITNLRPCTHRENLMNVGPRKHNTSGFKGVSFKQDKQKWKAYISVSKKQIHCGYFADACSAALARNLKDLELNGEFGYWNIIPSEVF